MKNQITYKKACFLLCLFFIVINVRSQQQALIDSLKQLVETTDNDSLKINTLNNLAHRYLYTNQEQSLNYAKRAYQLSKKLNIDREEALALRGIAAVLIEKDSLIQACNYLDLSIKIDSLSDRKLQISDAYNHYAKIYTKKGDHLKSIEYFFKSLKINDELGDDRTVAHMYANIASIYSNIGKHDLAIESAHKTLEYLKKSPHQLIEATALSALARAYYEKEEIQKALDYNQQMLVICEELNHLPGLAHCYNLEGMAYEHIQEYDRALDSYSKTQEIAEKYGDLSKIAIALSNKTVIYYQTHQYEKAIEAGQKPLEIFQQINNKYSLNDHYYTLSQCYAAIGKYKQAHDYLKKHKELNDSIFTLESEQQISDLHVEYETEKKNQKIELLEQKEQLSTAVAAKRKAWLIAVICILLVIIVFVIFYFRHLKVLSKQKRAELEQKALRAQMSPHFIFNSLNAIQDIYVDGDTNTANDYMADFAELMRKILDNSSKHSISVKEEMDMLHLYLQMEQLRCNDMISYEINIDKIIDTFNTNIPPLVIQPFVENAIWHGILPKKEKGHVSISIKPSPEELICTVEDNGVGFKATPNTKTHESKGIQLIEQRLGAKIKITHLNPGTRITLKLPIID